MQELAVLSDLSRPDTQRVAAAWSTIPEARRFHALEELVIDSKENLQLDLGRLLRIALTDESDRVRDMALVGLWEDLSGDLVGPLVYLMQNDPSPMVRAEAANSLGRFVLASELDEIDSHLGIMAEQALLAALLNESEHLDVQCRALESIAFSGETGIRDLIEDAYYSPYEEMQISALVAMGRSADTRWRTTVQTELQSDSPEMRAAAARSCGELENQPALAELIDLLEDPEQAVRLAAVTALGQIGGKKAVSALRDLTMLLGEEFPEYAAAQDALDELAFLSGFDVSTLDEVGDDWGEDDPDDEMTWADDDDDGDDEDWDDWKDDLDADLNSGVNRSRKDDWSDEWRDRKQNGDLNSAWDSDWDDES